MKLFTTKNTKDRPRKPGAIKQKEGYFPEQSHMSLRRTRRGWKIFETEAETDTDCETEAETDGMPHVGVSPALCLCASVPLCLFSGQE
jgi:hypothetical protein